jgi:hypothetical protein
MYATSPCSCCICFSETVRCNFFIGCWVIDLAVSSVIVIFRFVCYMKNSVFRMSFPYSPLRLLYILKKSPPVLITPISTHPIFSFHHVFSSRLLISSNINGLSGKVLRTMLKSRNKDSQFPFLPYYFNLNVGFLGILLLFNLKK